MAFSAACGFAGTLLSAYSLLGPLAERRFVYLIGIVLCFATAFGFLELGITAYAIERVNAAFAGVLLGLMSAWLLAGWSLVAGVAIAPALIIQSMLVTKTARAEHSTEAFTWTTSALLAGAAASLLAALAALAARLALGR